MVFRDTQYSNNTYPADLDEVIKEFQTTLYESIQLQMKTFDSSIPPRDKPINERIEDFYRELKANNQTLFVSEESSNYLLENLNSVQAENLD